MKQQSRCRCRSSFGATIFLVSVAVCLPVLLLNVMAMDGNETNGVDTTSRFDPDTLERLETMWHSQEAQLAKNGETKTELELPNQDALLAALMKICAFPKGTEMTELENQIRSNLKHHFDVGGTLAELIQDVQTMDTKYPTEAQSLEMQLQKLKENMPPEPMDPELKKKLRYRRRQVEDGQ